MSEYYNRNNRRRKRSRKEKIGFYTAFSICLIAVCMAVYSTYNTLSEPKITNSTEKVQVNQVATGVTDSVNKSTFSPTIPTINALIPTEVSTTPTEPSGTADALQTMLSTDLSLKSPLKTQNIIREFSKESMYFKTLNVWKPHLGVDFEGTLGDDVFAMTDGSVTDVKEDKLYGNTVEISVNNAVCIYSGLGKINVSKGDSVSEGDKIGVIGAVPFEASDKTHIHIAVKVNDKYADPLSFIGNNE